MIGLITVCQMQLAGPSYKIPQQEIHSVPFNLFQGVTTLRRRRGSPRRRSDIKKMNSPRVSLKLWILQSNPKVWCLSYTFKVDGGSQSLFELTELPAASRQLPEINIKRSAVYFASQRLALFL